MRQLVDELKSNIQNISLGGGEKARERHTSKGKLLVRERIDTLLDKGEIGIFIIAIACKYYNWLQIGPIHGTSFYIEFRVICLRPRESLSSGKDVSRGEGIGGHSPLPYDHPTMHADMLWLLYVKILKHLLLLWPKRSKYAQNSSF